MEVGYELLGNGNLGTGRYYLWKAGEYAAEEDLAIPDNIFEVMEEFMDLPESMRESKRKITDYVAGVVRKAVDLEMEAVIKKLDPNKGLEKYLERSKGDAEKEIS